MSNAILLWRDQLHKLSRPTTSNCAPNRFYSTSTSTRPPRSRRPVSITKLLSINHFGLRASAATNSPPANLGYKFAPQPKGRIFSLAIFVTLLLACQSTCLPQQKVIGPPLPGTEPLMTEGDIAAAM